MLHNVWYFLSSCMYAGSEIGLLLCTEFVDIVVIAESPNLFDNWVDSDIL